MPQPTLPKSQKKAAGTKKAGSVSQTMLLPDGTQLPVAIPPGMPAEQAAAVLEYLRNNPEAAKAAVQQANALMRNPAMAQAMLRGQTPNSAAAGAEMYEALKDDPDLTEVFEDVKANGMGALQKYWDDTELMSKISAKLRNVQLSKQQEQQQQGGAGGGAPQKHAPAARKVETLHDAARWGDAEAAGKLIDGGAYVNGKNDRGIPALGVAVGFNQKDMVRLLLDRGADVNAKDSQGSTALHYAAGYGRREVAEMLLKAGADLDATNAAKQKPVDVAKVNTEKAMVEFLKGQQAAGAAKADA